MKTLADVVADHVSSVLASVDSAARVMGVRAYSDARDRQVYLSAASDVLTATALALGLPADFGPALPAPALRLTQPYTIEQPSRYRLTVREHEVALLIVEGLSSKQIAQSLTLELSTVHAHRRSISRKAGTSSQPGLTARRTEWEVSA